MHARVDSVIIVVEFKAERQVFQIGRCRAHANVHFKFLANVALMSIRYGGLTNIIRIRCDDCIHQASAAVSLMAAVVGLAAPRRKDDETGAGLK
jgi:hypothetical protein